MARRRAVRPGATSPPPCPPRFGRLKWNFGPRARFAIRSIPVLFLFMIIFLAIPAGVPPESGPKLGSSLSSLGSSSSLVTDRWGFAISVKKSDEANAVKYPRMTLLLRFQGLLRLLRPSVTCAFARGPGDEGPIREEPLLTLWIVVDLGVRCRVRISKGEVLNIDAVVKVNRILPLGPRWAAMVDFFISSKGADESFQCDFNRSLSI